MNINKRLEQIDNFFESLTIEEFDKKLEKAGINEIKPSSDSNMELLLSSPYIIEADLDIQYENKKEVYTGQENYNNLYYDNYAEAV